MTSKHQIGKGKNMSIAKAGLVVYFEDRDFQRKYDYFDVGCPDPLHKIIDVAGAKHCSFLTPKQVIGRLRNSPYFVKKTIYGLYKGIRGNWRTSLLRPSEKGESYYKKELKQMNIQLYKKSN